MIMKLRITLEPLLGPIGGGLGLGAAAAAASAAGAAGAAAAASSVALTTSLEEEEPILLDFKGNISMVLLEEVVVLPATLSDNKNPVAADAMLLLAMTLSLSVCVSLLVILMWQKDKIRLRYVRV